MNRDTVPADAVNERADEALDGAVDPSRQLRLERRAANLNRSGGIPNRRFSDLVLQLNGGQPGRTKHIPY